jgi:dTMP kinase
MSILITIEGLDGAGKSLLTEKLQEAMLADSAFSDWVYATKEPGSVWTGVGPQIRELVLNTPEFQPFERELLFCVDASIHSRFISNQQNAIIVSDRGLWSHLAYLRGYLKTKQMNYEDYSLCKTLIGKVCHQPDCIVYLSADLPLMAERLQGKKKDAIESNKTDFFHSVLESYQDLITDRQQLAKPLISLDARDSLDKNIMKVIDYLKGVFHETSLRQGN